jgi:hypothetical protein
MKVGRPKKKKKILKITTKRKLIKKERKTF